MEPQHRLLRAFSLFLFLSFRFLLSLAHPAFPNSHSNGGRSLHYGVGSLHHGGGRRMARASEDYLPSRLQLDLVHRDFGILSNATQAQKMQQAVQRSGLRLSHIQKVVSTKVVAASLDDYQIPVSAAQGAFTTTITIGTPGVSFTAIVDTGSDLVWRQCKPCTYCYSQTGPIFDPSTSSTYRKASCTDALCKALPLTQCTPDCEYGYSYGDQSSTIGYFSYDTLTLKDPSGTSEAIPNFGFGCGNDNEGSNFAGAGGIVGLGRGAVSLTSQLSLPLFSYCLQFITDAASKTSPLFLGSAASIGSSNVQSTPILTSSSVPSLYYLSLEGISVGGTLLDIPAGTFDLQSDGSGGIIIDSGTTLTYLEQAGYSVVLKAFQSSINLPTADGSSIGLDLCYETSGEVPSLTFHFDGADFNLPTSNYFVTLEGLFCLALASSSGISIFGNIQQQNFHILYDRGSQKLSFAPATCDQL